MADTGGGSQLITAQAPREGSTSGTLTWWDRRDGHWVKAGSVVARFGAKGLAEGGSRKQGSNTMPHGPYDLPFAFGIKAAPAGTAVPYRWVREESWWCQDNDSRSYNRWTEPRPADRRASESSILIAYEMQYAYALVVGFNDERPVRVGPESSCTSTGPGRRLVVCRCRRRRCGGFWRGSIRRGRGIAIGTVSGGTALTRY